MIKTPEYYRYSSAREWSTGILVPYDTPSLRVPVGEEIKSDTPLPGTYYLVPGTLVPCYQVPVLHTDRV